MLIRFSKNFLFLHGIYLFFLEILEISCNIFSYSLKTCLRSCGSDSKRGFVSVCTVERKDLVEVRRKEL